MTTAIALDTVKLGQTFNFLSGTRIYTMIRCKDGVASYQGPKGIYNCPDSHLGVLNDGLEPDTSLASTVTRGRKAKKSATAKKSAVAPVAANLPIPSPGGDPEIKALLMALLAKLG